MAIEHRAVPPWTAPALTTAVKARRFVVISSTKSAAGAVGFVKHSTAGTKNYVGVSLNGTTGSTRANQAISILSYGIARVDAAAGSVKQGVLVTASSQGKASTVAATGVPLGICVAGSTGGLNRVVSVLLYPFGHSS